jgi:hypothetical protein
MKEKLARQKKSSKNTTDAGEPSHRRSTPGDTTDSASVQVCEICERPGHDIFSCDLLKEDVPPHSKSSRVLPDLFCDDCESHGHAASDCPHSLEVF